VLLKKISAIKEDVIFKINEEYDREELELLESIKGLKRVTKKSF